MDPGDRFLTLVEAGVLAEGDTQVSLTPAFAARLDSVLSTPAGEVAASPVADEFLSAYEVALREALSETPLEPEPLVPLVLSLHRPPELTAGTPEGFLPIRGEDLGRLVAYTPAGVVYVWQDDCEPCDVMAERLADLVDEVADLAALSVYGPGDMEALYDEFDVYGAPTTLFVADSRIDSRLVGTQPPQAIERELKIVTDDSQ